MKAEQLRINPARLMDRLNRLAEIGATADGSCCRLALTDEDKAGRDLVAGWMRELGLEVRIDPIGNIFGLRKGSESVETCAPVMCGSHIDTVRTGGRYDGNLGVLGGLEVVQTLNDAGLGDAAAVRGRRSSPTRKAHASTRTWLGSLVYVGGMALDELYATKGIDGKVFGDELERIGYLGDAPVPAVPAACLRRAARRAGPGARRSKASRSARSRTCRASRGTRSLITGQSNHAGTTPMRHAARRRLLRGGDRRVRAQSRHGDRRPPGRHGRGRSRCTRTSSTSSRRARA